MTVFIIVRIVKIVKINNPYAYVFRKQLIWHCNKTNMYCQLFLFF